MLEQIHDHFFEIIKPIKNVIMNFITIIFNKTGEKLSRKMKTLMFPLQP